MIGVLHHPRKPASEPLAAEIGRWLQTIERPHWVRSAGDESFIESNIGGCTLLIVIGGDGSILRAARQAAPHQVPIFSINMGRVGFLSEAQPDEWHSVLQRVLAGDYWLEKRLMLRATVLRNGTAVAERSALNDFVVSRGTQARVLRLRLDVDGAYVTRYVADGIIVATPTGSTAYALAAGGPILPPALRNYLIVPVAPHLSLDRTVVLHEQALATIHVRMDHEATLTSDGQDDIVELKNRDQVQIRTNDHVSIFARVGDPGYFYRRLMARLSPNDGPEPDDA